MVIWMDTATESILFDLPEMATVDAIFVKVLCMLTSPILRVARTSFDAKENKLPRSNKCTGKTLRCHLLRWIHNNISDQ